MANFSPCVRCIRHLSTRGTRVVVTGAGVVSCLGTGVDTVWNRLLQGKSGICKLEGEGYEQIPCQVAGHVPTGKGKDKFCWENVTSSSERGLSLTTAYTLAAAEEALSCAGWKPQDEMDRLRTGVCIGTGMTPLETIVDAGTSLRTGKYRRITPWFIPEILINIPAGHVSLRYGFKGPNHSVSTACTTGLHAIGDAFRFICHGDADVMLAGGADGCISPLSIAGFARMRALCTKFNHSPQEASRPFDAKRDGFVMSEGAGLLVLEELSHAQQRGATIWGEVLGYGLTGDAHHLTTPSGDGAKRCILGALKDAGIAAEDVGHVNAHATSTPVGDTLESQAIEQVLGNKVLVTSTKGALGHQLGAAGSVEAILALKACQTGVVPHTVNLTQPDTGCDLDYVMGSPRPWSGQKRRVALTNSFGFGGTNGSLCLAEYVP